MTTDRSPSAASPGPGTSSWRELAVARSLDAARSRAETRVQRFLDAALELMSRPEGKDFTVQEVVERSGQSLRSFYQYFAGKHELLLALFEESVRSTAEHLREQVAGEDDPHARLHRFVVECYRLCGTTSKGRSAKKGSLSPAIVDFAQQLLTDHPKEAARAFEPLVALLEDLMADAAAAGTVRAEVRRGRIVGVVLQAIMFNRFSATISGSSVRAGDDAADQLWDLLLHGIGTGTGT